MISISPALGQSIVKNVQKPEKHRVKYNLPEVRVVWSAKPDEKGDSQEKVRKLTQSAGHVLQ